MNNRIVVFGLVLLMLAGCGRVVREGGTNAPEASRFVAEASLDAARIAALRAAPPAETQFLPGKQLDADEDRLGAKGYVRVGIGYYRDVHAEVPADAQEQASELGADQALIYTPEAADGETRVAFFVRMALPFGATFRDLNDAESHAVGGNGVQLGSIVGGSPASRANLQAGDIVLKVNEKNVVGKKEFQQLLSSRAGQRVTLLVWRDGRTESRMVRLGVPPTSH
jgi:C-terminal processing protease CtpA/Prc